MIGNKRLIMDVLRIDKRLYFGWFVDVKTEKKWEDVIIYGYFSPFLFLSLSVCLSVALSLFFQLLLFGHSFSTTVKRKIILLG